VLLQNCATEVSTFDPIHLVNAASRLGALCGDAQQMWCGP
jgi:hypothetical protein